MKKSFFLDYSAYILVRTIYFLLRPLPVGFCYFLGRRLGELVYFFDVRHRALVYANIKRALPEKTGGDLIRISLAFYRNFGQNLIEIFIIPRVDQEYIKKYIRIEGLEYIHDCFKLGRGLILLGVHAGSWELSNVICANLGFPFNLFVRGQDSFFLDAFLSRFRKLKGGKLIQRENSLRSLIEILKKNEAIGMTLDQGGRNGMVVDFLNGESSLATGALKLALRHGIPIIPVYYRRIRGPYLQIILGAPIFFSSQGWSKEKLRLCLKQVAVLFEGLIRRYPEDYLWTYKIWKYGRKKKILVLDDGKAGHFKQAESLANIVAEFVKPKGKEATIVVQKVEFKNSFSRIAQVFCSLFTGRYNCQGCLRCLRRFLKREIFLELFRQSPDYVISCGSSLAGVNYLIARENLAKSLVVMRPSFLPWSRFDLVVIPCHDRPLCRHNVVTIEGALNFVDERQFSLSLESLKEKLRIKDVDCAEFIAFLLGGDSKGFTLSSSLVASILRQLKDVAQKNNFGLLVSTSRRTPRELEKLVKKELENFSFCKLLIIANEKNIPGAVSAILGLSRIAVVSPESISMISEAVLFRRHVLVFEASGLSRKHLRFLEDFTDRGYIYLTKEERIADLIQEIIQKDPPIRFPDNKSKIEEALERIL